MSRISAWVITALILCAGLGFQPALATTVTVPDAFPTVQQGIDSGADTVQIREGTYPERPVVDHAVVLQGLGSRTRPQLAGMQIYNSNFWETPPLLSISQIHFLGGVNHTAISVAPRNLQISLSECSLDSGFVQILSIDPDDLASLTLRDCRLLDSSARAYQVLMERDTIDGGVAWRAQEPSIQHCWFRGGPGAAIQLGDAPLAGLTAFNQVASYAAGVAVAGGDPYTISDNTISYCGTGIQLTNGNEVTVIGNTIRSCGTGIDDQGVYRLALFGNTILGASGPGIQAFASGVIAEQNVIGNSGMEGIVTVYPDVSELRRNTIFHNGGSGIVARLPGGYAYPVKVEGNIGVANGGWGLAVDDRLGAVMTLGCNDWFANAVGAVSGVGRESTDVSLNPLFCSVDSADVRLDAASPLLADSAACGQIGALGVGCGVTATVVQRFTAGRVGDGVRVVWEIAPGATASAVWVERAEGLNGQGWTEPLMDRSIEGRTVVELDRSAAPDRAYRYRLVARDGGKLTVLDPGILVEAQARLTFGLVEVGPSPGSGPVRIAFSLAHAAEIEIDVFDVQGRRVASPGRGEWPAGASEIAWDGRTRSGQPAAAGLYLVRYRYPGGQDRRGIVRIR